MCEVKVLSHNFGQTSYWLTYFWFHINPTSYCYDRAFLKVDFQNPRSKSKLMDTKLVHPIHSYPFRSMLIGSPVPEIQLFQNLTLKIQGQDHGWGQSFKLQCESSILSTHIPLVSCQLSIPFLRYSIFKVWPWKSKVKIIAQGHKLGLTPYRLISFSSHVNRPSHSWDRAISKSDVENSMSRS